MIYHHYNAIQNGSIVDVLISQEEAAEHGAETSEDGIEFFENADRYFLHGATDIEYQGPVEIDYNNALPDVLNSSNF